MKRTYSSMWTGEDLDEDYGNSTHGPPKDRRAGAEHCELKVSLAVLQVLRQCCIERTRGALHMMCRVVCR